MTSPWETIVYVMKHDRDIQFDNGMTDAELDACEEEFGFHFPADLREFLGHALPVSDRFPNWRGGDREDLKSWLQLPVEGIVFDVQHNGFWLPEWGERPSDADAAAEVVRTLVAEAPKLIPIYAHRMIPDRPATAGNPVFSVHQTDIIYYGCNLRDYFLHEFFADKGLSHWPPANSVRPIEFWDLDRFATRWDDEPYYFDAAGKTLR